MNKKERKRYKKYIKNFYKKLDFLKNYSFVERREKGLEALRKKYPNAPESMIDTAIFHAYVDGMHACIDWIVSLAEFLEDPKKGFNMGKVYHLLYHLYNLMLIENMLPVGSDKLLEIAVDMKIFLKKKDYFCVEECIETLECYASGNSESAPSLM